MTYMEILYRIWRRLGERTGKAAYLRLKALPVRRIDVSEDLLLVAARIKAAHDLSVADAWIAATASLTRSRLVHKDPEFRPLTGELAMLPPAARLAPFGPASPSTTNYSRNSDGPDAPGGRLVPRPRAAPRGVTATAGRRADRPAARMRAPGIDPARLAPRPHAPGWPLRGPTSDRRGGGTSVPGAPRGAPCATTRR